ncbi:tail fiber domain-containing protein [Bdellovibrio sp. NC01]|uniref:tail fiber domain-containing protein n=1 Tax=Bdellovibrio sp. NC01 TaxID=2220073 RepID=UPI0011599958|nr:tail fiber domain-containing protein [Bdellovibrio sp. NC01]QDK36608.1 hypothetical protein DOE51_02830 [Bdellovibrio sp. NC01]
MSLATYLKHLILLAVIFFHQFVMASPAVLTYQGRILKTDGTPLENNNVSFIFQVTDPSGLCVVYQEQVNGINMVNSGGVFDVPIGKGSVAYPTSGSFTVLDAFNNGATFTCQGGSPYSPAASDERRLRVQFYDGTGWKVISPDSVVRSVPYAGYSYSAAKLGTNVASDFVLKTGIPTCASGTFLSWDGTQLTCAGVAGASGGTVTNVTSANSYITIINNTSTPTLTLNVGTSTNTVAAGNDPRFSDARTPTGSAGGDLSGTYPNPSVAKIRGSDVDSATPTSGQVLKFDGAKYTPVTLAIGDVSGLSANLSSYLTKAAFNGYVASASCSVSETMYWNSVSGNFQCQTINVGLAGDVTGSIGAAKVVALQNQPVDATVPTSNQVLQWNGSKWIPATLPAGNAGTVTSVSGTAPISVATGTSTPVVSISQATTSTNGYLSSADWNTFNNKQAAGNYVTALTGDVTASGPGSAAATVAKLQGSTLTLTAPANKDYLKFNGTAFVNSPLAASDLTGTLPASALPAFTGDVTSSAGSTTLTLAAAGTAGTYYKVTTDSKGRVTSGSASLVAADIPSLDWSKITSGKPTSLSGYGIADQLVTNAGGTPSIQTGTDALKPGSPSAGAIYFATDTKIIYQYNSSAWVAIASATGSGGTITALTSDVSASGSGSVAATVNSVGGSTAAQVHSAELAANAATNANTASAIVKRDASGNFAASNVTHAANTGDVYTAGSGSNTVTVQGPSGAVTANYVLRLPTAQGSANQIMLNDGAGNLSWIAQPSSSGQVLRYNGTTWVPNFVSMFDLRSTITGTQAFGGVGCTAGQTLTWTAATDNLSCTNISVTSSQVSFGSQTANTFFAAPNGSAGTPTFRTLAAADLPTSGVGAGTYKSVTVDTYGRVTAGTNPTTLSGYGITDAFAQGGNSFGATAVLGTNDSNKLSLETGGTTRMTVDTSGNVGINTTNPTSMLQVDNGYITTGRYGSSGTTAGALVLQSADGTQAAPTAVASGRLISYIGGRGWDGAAYREIASIGFSSDAAISSSSSPGLITFGTTPSGATATIERMRIAANGLVGIGTTAPTSALTVGGGLTNGDILLKAGSGLPNDAGDVIFANYSGTQLGRIWTDGGGGSGMFLTGQTGVTNANMYLANNGYVGIGTTSPVRQFHLNGVGTEASMVLSRSDGMADKKNWRIMAQNSGAGNANNFYIDQINDAGTAATNMMTILPNGNVGIGTSAPNYRLHVPGVAAIAAIVGGETNGSGNFHLDSWSSGADRAVYINWGVGTGGLKVGNGSSTWGPAYAASFNVTSDRRLKENIKPIENPLEKVLQLEGVTFTWKDKNRAAGEGPKIGVIAQNIEKVFPQAVRIEHGESSLPGGTKVVSYPDLVAPLIGAVKELYHKWFDDSQQLHALVESQAREIASIKEQQAQTASENEKIKAENQEMKARLDRLEKLIEKK